MNKTLTLSFFLVCFSFHVFSQSRNYNPGFDSKVWVGIPLGLAFPVGDFADDDLANVDAGLAKLGLNGRIDLGIKIYQQIGFCASVVAGQNGFDEEAIKSVIPRSSSVVLEVNSSKWKYIGGLGGLYLAAPLGKGALMLKGQLGYAHTQSPSLDIRVRSGSTYARSNQKSGSGDALLMCFGLTGLFDINEMAFFTMGLDYMSTQPTFSNIEVMSEGSGSPTVYENISFKMNMSWVVFNMGFCRKF